MDDDTTFDERVSEVRRGRRDPVDVTGLSAAGDGVTGQPPRGYTPDFNTTSVGNDCNCEAEVESLRRDMSRLEGKIDALLAALGVEDGDR